MMDINLNNMSLENHPDMKNIRSALALRPPLQGNDERLLYKTIWWVEEQGYWGLSKEVNIC